ncbi:unnamed protein product [Brachionus calyciflorus]|uniref:G-protein coupled receptors family 1 profile domain-containing protein n=1 Tax=Brachionus calyciflorus TaxID=104777 RepID=A0A814BWM8_9BILA|nr:unnamed protein product [Brachionus calyciflorus]
MNSIPSFFYVLIDGSNLIVFIIGCFVILVTICLNLFVVFTVVSDKSMRNYTNIQFASMSCADTLVGSIAMPLLLVSTLYDYWPFSEDMCVLFIIGDFVGGNISMITLTIISYHRLKCIKKPFGVIKKTHFESLLPSLFLWPIIFLFWTIPTIIIVKNLNIKNSYMNRRDCYYKYSLEYVIIVDLIAYILPIFLLMFFQISIYVSLKNKKKLMNPVNFNKLLNNEAIEPDCATSSSWSTYSLPSHMIESENMTRSAKIFSRSNTINTFEKNKAKNNILNNRIIEGVVSTSVQVGQVKKEKRLSSFRKKSEDLLSLQKSIKNQQHLLFSNNYKKNQKAFRTLFFVTCSLIVLWFPWMVSWPIDAYCNCVPRGFYALTYWLEYLNSLVNSVILIAGNQHFRRKFLLLFKKNIQN